MRYGLLVLGILACIGMYRGWFADVADRATTAMLTEDAHLALELRCRGQIPQVARECRSTLKKLYLSGALDPETTLRTYCNSVETAGWGSRRSPLPRVCVERYGARRGNR